MKPCIGDIVHYTNLGDRDGKFPPEVQAALITKVKFNGGDAGAPGSYTVSLHIFYPTGQFDMHDVPFTQHEAGSDDARGRWTFRK